MGGNRLYQALVTSDGYVSVNLARSFVPVRQTRFTYLLAPLSHVVPCLCFNCLLHTPCGRGESESLRSIRHQTESVKKAGEVNRNSGELIRIIMNP